MDGEGEQKLIAAHSSKLGDIPAGGPSTTTIGAAYC
jgi:hypothetical protein